MSNQENNQRRRRRPHVLGIRLDDPERIILNGAAIARSESLSSFVRRTALAAAVALQSRTPALADVELKADSATIERKASLRLTSFKSKADRTFTAVFWVADGKPDLDGDAGSPDAFREGEQVVISAWAHSAATGDAVPVGKGTIHIDGVSIIVRGLFFTTTAGNDAYQTIKELAEFVELSMAYRAEKSREPTNEERSRGIERVLLAVSVLEVSFVLRGAAGPGRSGIREIKRASTAGNVDVAAIAAQVRAREEILNPPLPPEELAMRWKEHITRYQREVGPLTECPVDSEKHAAAMRFAAWVADKCGVSTFGIKWFATGALGPAVGGCYKSGDRHIWVRASAENWDLIRVIAHEGSHLVRYFCGLPDSEEIVRADENQLVDLYLSEIAS